MSTFESSPPERERIAVVGLGYVGLPLALALAQTRRVVAYDRSSARIEECRRGIDRSGELSSRAFSNARTIEWSDDPTSLGFVDVVIVAVPTPVDDRNAPDFEPLLDACRTVGAHMKRSCLVVFESTVYPGATEEICIPELERASRMSWPHDFNVGYSPERINPGDPDHGLAQVIKVISGDSTQTLDRLHDIYGSVVSAGIHRASSIRVAEAAKVIENTQRDLNVALMNELSIIFHRLDIDTHEVLAAAATKWNFAPFRPGLVGGHCIGVDPYYLTHQAERAGYHPEVILAGRRINDGMASYVAARTLDLIERVDESRPPRVIVLGLAFKENCGDLRRSQAAVLVAELQARGCDVSVNDPRSDEQDARREYGIELIPWASLPREADAIILAVPHRQFTEMSIRDLLAPLRSGGILMDLKAVFEKSEVTEQGRRVWRL